MKVQSQQLQSGTRIDHVVVATLHLIAMARCKDRLHSALQHRQTELNVPHAPATSQLAGPHISHLAIDIEHARGLNPWRA